MSKIKTLTIGDVHGYDIWKYINHSLYDYIIFTGDYFDSFNITNKKILSNFDSLVKFKLENFNNVILLVGNHDAQYFLYHHPLNNELRCNGRRSNLLWHAYTTFEKYPNCFQVAFQIKNYLWSHAGLSNKAYDLYFKKRIQYISEYKLYKNSSLADKLNHLWRLQDSSLFPIGAVRDGRYDIGSILWADISETIQSPLNNYNQIVGHSPIINNIYTHVVNDTTSITYTDVLRDYEYDELMIGYNFPFYELTIEV